MKTAIFGGHSCETEDEANQVPSLTFTPPASLSQQRAGGPSPGATTTHSHRQMGRSAASGLSPGGIIIPARSSLSSVMNHSFSSNILSLPGAFRAHIRRTSRMTNVRSQKILRHFEFYFISTKSCLFVNYIS